MLNGASRIYIYPFVVKMEQGNDIGMKNIARNVVAILVKYCHIRNADKPCFICISILFPNILYEESIKIISKSYSIK